MEASAIRDGDELHVRVRDTGPALVYTQQHGHGIGLSNTRERLDHFYQDGYKMQAHPLSTGGFEVAITIPYERGSMKIRALIADDEPLARERLRFLLVGGRKRWRWPANAATGEEVIAALKESRFDVLFLDIQMPGKDGFEVIDQIGPAQMPVTVFVTAHNEYAVQAFEVHALDYLTKPVEPERLQATLVRVKERIASQAALMTQEQMKSVLQQPENSGAAAGVSPAVTGSQRHARIPSSTSMRSIGSKRRIITPACTWVARSFMLRETIKQLSETLDPGKFVRIHRSVIVNVDQVSEIFREGQSEGSVVLKTGQRLRMSKAGWQGLVSVSRR